MLVGLLVMAGPLASAEGQWQWPAPSGELDTSEILDGMITPWWSVLGRADGVEGDRRTYRFLASGNVLYHDTEPSGANRGYTVPRNGDLVVVRHDHGFWTFYAGEDLRLSSSRWSQGGAIDSRSTFEADGVLSFAIFDAVRHVFVNPRAVLPEQSELPEDGLPVVGFIQDGALTLSRNLTAGEAQFVILQEWLEPAQLPRRIYVLIDGLVEAEVDFTHPENVAQRMTPNGHVMLLPLRLEPGSVLVEVESHQFDGSVERRAIPIRVPESVVLDTP